MTEGLATALGHHFDRQATVKVLRRFPYTEFRLFGLKQCIHEGFVLVSRHWAVDIGLALVFRRALVVARLLPGNGHVHAIRVDDRSYGIKEGQALFAAFCLKCFAKSA